jgi:hypothetical protein
VIEDLRHAFFQNAEALDERLQVVEDAHFFSRFQCQQVGNRRAAMWRSNAGERSNPSGDIILRRLFVPRRE